MSPSRLPMNRIPRPDPRVFHGLAGDIVRLIEPSTEADRVGVLLQLLAAFASAVGPRPHFIADDCRYPLNLYVALVGCSPVARMAAGWRRAYRLVADAEPQWGERCVAVGLHDAGAVERVLRERLEKGGEAADLRLLLFEPELAPVLDVAARPGSALGRVLRAAWQREPFRPLDSRGANLPDAAHLCVVGHIRLDQLQQRVSPRLFDAGFADRFVWASVERSKLLPDGDGVDGGADDRSGRDTLQRDVLVESLRAAIRFGQRTECIRRDAGAAEVWRENYATLTQDVKGPLAPLAANVLPQAMRLSCLYALLDESAVVTRHHLLPGLFLTQYWMASAEWSFRGQGVHGLAVRLLEFIAGEPGGVSRTRIRDALSRNRRAADIDEALRQLAAAGLVTRSVTKGRSFNPVETWFPGPGKTTADVSQPYSPPAANGTAAPNDPSAGGAVGVDTETPTPGTA